MNNKNSSLSKNPKIVEQTPKGSNMPPPNPTNTPTNNK